MRPMTLVLFLLVVTLANVQCDKYGDAVPASVTHLSTHKYQIEVQMPGNDPKVDDDYLCRSFKVPQDGYIDAFETISSDDRVHHLFLFGCSGEPAYYNTTWSCLMENVCADNNSNSKLLYAWGRNAPAFKIPDDVGVAVGKAAKGPTYLVLQVHYLLAEKGNVQDYTAVRLTGTTVKPDNLALIYALVYGGSPIPPGVEADRKNMSCKFEVPSKVHVFAYRVHAHALGQVISGYRYNNNNDKRSLWAQIGKKNPQWPQMFYPVEGGPMEISPNDILLGQCTFNSTSRKSPTYIGSTHNDEMCNFYLYYYLPAEEADKMQVDACVDNQFPNLFKSYPAEGSTLLPSDPSMEMSGAEMMRHFGVVEAQNWPDPNLKLGQVGGVAYMGSYRSYKDILVVFHRSTRIWDETSFDEQFVLNYKDPIEENTVVMLNSDDGSILKRWGAGLFYVPHGTYVDKDNNIWLTDVGLHQVFKFKMTSDLKFTEALSLGEKLVPGGDGKHFCQPAAVVTIADGSIFVADGYCNSRIVKFTPEGKYLNEWGRPNEDVEMKNRLYPPLGDFRIVHDISADEVRGLLYVADRENGRIQVFNYASEEFVRQIHPHQFGGALYGVKYCAATDDIFALNGQSDRIEQPLRVFSIDPDNDGLWYSFAGSSQPFTRPHTLAISSNCLKVFVGEIGPDRLWKFNISFTNRHAKTEVQPAVELATSKPLSSEPNNASGNAFPAAITKGKSKMGMIVGCAIGIPIGVALLLFAFMQCRKRLVQSQQDIIPLVGQPGYGATS